jgi:hypothetical protein
MLDWYRRKMHKISSRAQQLVPHTRKGGGGLGAQRKAKKVGRGLGLSRAEAEIRLIRYERGAWGGGGAS